MMPDHEELEEFITKQIDGQDPEGEEDKKDGSKTDKQS